MGNFLASEHVTEARRAHCDPCEHNKMGICKRCGCIIQAKTRLAGQRCPIGLWGREELGLRSLKFR